MAHIIPVKDFRSNIIKFWIWKLWRWV